MAKVHKGNLLGSWSFLIGLVLAVLLGLGIGGAYSATMLWLVFVLGLVVGLLNISAKEVGAFLNGGTILVLVSFLGVQTGVFTGQAPVIANVLNGILVLFVPATIVVAIKSVFALARR
tara:strand:- start:23 stop:376 length:354 start_codon:yes stop_codon:yes gene_type:complete